MIARNAGNSTSSWCSYVFGASPAVASLGTSGFVKAEPSNTKATGADSDLYALRRRNFVVAVAVIGISLAALSICSGVVKLPTHESIQALGARVFGAISATVEAVKNIAVDLTNWFFSTAYPVIEDLAVKVSAFALEYFALGLQVVSDGLIVCGDQVVATGTWLRDGALVYLNPVFV